ncbi:MAG: hypothetical protein M1833_007278 [Piccolia ochrophora]|nr:MAG: hypothetical protein M1833_007278 [Piccolia ochrophora]
MSTLALPEPFKQSYESAESYPLNLVYQTSYFNALHAYQTRLDDAEPKLFTKKDAEVFVPFRDVLSTGQGFEKQNILDDEALKAWLGDKSTTRSGALATKKDRKCRFIFISSGHSRAPLKITRRMLVRILSYHQVMPSYLDFISVFGSHRLSRELRFSGFREQTLLTHPPDGLAVRNLGRTGRQFQLCYNLKAVACLSNASTTIKNKEWSIRQAAFHHQFDVVEGTTLWIITKGNLDMKERIQSLTSKDGRQEDRSFGTLEECFKSSLAVHLLYCHWSMEEWRWYIQWLEDVIDLEGPRGVREAQHNYTSRDLQTVQNYEDKTNEAIMILEANADVLKALCKFYETLKENQDFPPRRTCYENINIFSTQVDDIIYDSKMQVSRAKLLVRITADRKNLVLQHLQSQTTDKMEALTRSMHSIGIMSQKEAIAMRIITVVTLIYLPATFVSTFFSADIVKYQDEKDEVIFKKGPASDPPKPFGGSFSKVALERWLQVALPLTALTLVGALFFFKRADRKRKRESNLILWTDSRDSLP